ncbi:MAG: TldD/PmbA family protein [Planctomycetota bacterium]
MNPKKLLDIAASKSDSAEVFHSKSTSLSVSFENNSIKDSSSSELAGVGVRAIKDGRIGFSSSTHPTDERVASIAPDLAKFGKNVNFDFPSPSSQLPFSADLSGAEAVTESMAVELCESAAEQIRALDDKVLAFSGITRSSSSSHLVNTNGLDLKQDLAFVTWYSGLVLNTEGNFIQIYRADYGPKFGGFDSQIADVAETFRLCSENVRIPTGKYRVLLSPRGVLNLVNVFSACLNGMSVAKGISPWGDRLGDQLFDERFTLLTDLVSYDSPIRMAYDNEGTPTGRRSLIENGVLRSFVHTLSSAGQCGHEPSGHGFRGPTSQPSGEMRCARILPGDGQLDAMKGDAQLWIDELIGAIMSNPYGGIISGNIALGFTMENGSRKARIKDAMMSVNVFEAFKSAILAISSETKQEGSWIVPYLLLDGVSIASK